MLDESVHAYTNTACVLKLVHAILLLKKPPQLTVFTLQSQGVQTFSHSLCSGWSQTAVWGLFRSIRNERPMFSCRCVDLADRQFGPIDCLLNEPEVAATANTHYCRRLVISQHQQSPQPDSSAARSSVYTFAGTASKIADAMAAVTASISLDLNRLNSFFNTEECIGRQYMRNAFSRLSLEDVPEENKWWVGRYWLRWHDRVMREESYRMPAPKELLQQYPEFSGSLNMLFR